MMVGWVLLLSSACRASPIPEAQRYPAGTPFRAQYRTIDGTRLRMMVDTGATLVVLSRDDARLIGINPAPADFRIKVSTANGPVLVAPIMLKEITVGAISVRDVPAAVFPDNQLQLGLLGMSFLSKLSHFEVEGGRLVLKW